MLSNNRLCLCICLINNTLHFYINFSGNIGVIKTRPGYASSIAYNLDNSDIPEILGTIAGDDTIFIVIKAGVSEYEIIDTLNELMLNM